MFTLIYIYIYTHHPAMIGNPMAPWGSPHGSAPRIEEVQTAGRSGAILQWAAWAMADGDGLGRFAGILEGWMTIGKL